MRSLKGELRHENQFEEEPLTRGESIVFSSSTEDMALQKLILQAVAAPIAWNKNSKAALIVVCFALEIRCVRLHPSNGPIWIIGIGSRQASAIWGDNDGVVLSIDPRPPLLPALPLPLKSSRGRTHPIPIRRSKFDGIGLQEPRGVIGEGIRSGIGSSVALRTPWPIRKTIKSNIHSE